MACYHPRHCRDSKLKHSGLSKKEAYLLVQALWPEEQASSSAHLGAYRVALRERRQVDATFTFSPCLVPQLASISQKGAYTLVWRPDFCGCCQGALLHHLALVAHGAYTRGSHRTVTNRERVLKQLPPSGHKRQQTQEPSLSVKEPISLSSQLQPEGQASN